MHRTVATNHSSNRYVDESAPNADDGTLLKASDRNAVQEEIANVIEREQTLDGEAGDTEIQLAHAVGARGFVGDGTSGTGDLVTAGDTTLTGHALYDNITVSAGDTLDTGGFVLRARKRITIEAGAKIVRNGNDAVADTPGAALAESETGPSEAGGAGGQAGGSNGSDGGSTPANNSSIGANGGAGGAATGSAGAAGTRTLPGTNMGPWRILPHAAVGVMLDAQNARIHKLRGGAGGSGGGGAAGDAGGGGSGGGVIICIAPVIDNQGAIEAKGGDGGDAAIGGDGGGGGGGGGGAIILITRTLEAGTTLGQIGTLDVSGGAGGGGADSNDGNAGGTGQTCILSL